MITPSLEEFMKLTRQGNLIPVFEEIHYDLETPISAFRKIDDQKTSFLLESVEGGEKWGRYSFLGSGSSYLFRSKGKKFDILRCGETIRQGEDQDPLRALEEFLSHYHPVQHDNLPRFSGGAVGYLGYDVARSFEKIPDRLREEVDLYDTSFMVTDTLLIFDNLKKKIKVVFNAFLDDGVPPEQAYQEAQDKIKSLIARLRAPDLSPLRQGSSHPSQ